MLLQKLENQKLIHPPKWLANNTCYLGYAGSVAYGASSDTSDMDCFGFCIPPKEIVFPYTAGGEIAGFGMQKQRFRVWTEHHIESKGEGKNYDFSVYNIVDFFHLAMENNPNIVDVLFLPRRCIIHSTPIGEHVRANRKVFLHKGSFHKFRGYMFSQMTKIRNKTNSSNAKRAESIAESGYDKKFAYHVIRLALEAEQILVEHDLDLERNSEILKSIRRGEWSLEQIDQWATEKERALETAYVNSTLRNIPDEAAIKKLLLECLEMMYGNLAAEIVQNQDVASLIQELQSVIQKYS